MQAARSTAFASFDTNERSRKGINGALTPARQHRNHHQKNTNDFYAASTTTPQTPSRLVRLRQERLEGGEGISLQETEARIDELERSEFDLKLKLFYMEEQLESASGGEDVLHLHKEVMDAKLHRSHAEQKARAAGEALSGLEAKCRELRTQARDSEAQRAKDRENWAMADGENEARLKKHTQLLEDALRAERAENARLRLAIYTDARRGDWDGGGQQQQPRGAAARRRVAGEDSRGQPDPWRGSGGSGGGFGREHRDHQQQQLTAKIRSQDSSLRSLRADVTTLRRRLRTQAEALAQQKEENGAVRRAAEQVACVEAEEIARLAVDLERAVRAAKAEADKRRQVESHLAAAEARLSGWGTGPLEDRGSQSKGSTPPIPSPDGRTRGGGEREWGRRRPADDDIHAGGDFQAPPEEDGDRECNPLPPPPPPPPPPRGGALGSTIASRGRSVHDRPAAAAAGWGNVSPGGLRGSGRPSVSPRRSRNAETIGHRRPWGSSPPPSPCRKGDGPGAPVAPSRHRPPVDGGGGGGGGAAASAERKQHRRRLSEERMAAEEASAGGGRGGNKPGNPPARQTARESPGRERRNPSAVRRGAVKDAHAEAHTAAVAPGARRERQPAGGSRGQGTPAAGAAEALRGVDLTAKIAQELRAAVATTPASAVSPAYFSDHGSSGQNTPAGGGRVGGDERQEADLGCLEGGDLLKSIWQGTSQYAWDGAAKNKPTVAMKSREVAELESDVQHIFKFFAAKDGRKLSGLLRAADRGVHGEEEFTTSD